MTVRRPALVVARRDTGSGCVLLWTVMVTSAERAPWAGDVPIPGTPETGLRVPSKVRTAKISTVEDVAATAIARLDARTWQRVLNMIEIGAPSPPQIEQRP